MYDLRGGSVRGGSDEMVKRPQVEEKKSGHTRPGTQKNQ